MYALPRRPLNRVISIIAVTALSASLAVAVAPSASAAGLTVTASSVDVTAGDAVPQISFTATDVLTTDPTCAVFDPADTSFLTPLIDPLAQGTYVSHCSGAVPLPDLYVDGVVNALPVVVAPLAAPIVAAPLLAPAAVTASIAAGGDHSCTLLSSGGVTCWGNNASGQLGDGTTNNSTTPVYVSGLTTATALDAGANHTCAIRTGGTVVCWGQNAYGQIGTGVSGGAETTPVVVAGVTGAIAIAAGDFA